MDEMVYAPVALLSGRISTRPLTSSMLSPGGTATQRAAFNWLSLKLSTSVSAFAMEDLLSGVHAAVRRAWSRPAADAAGGHCWGNRKTPPPGQCRVGRSSVPHLSVLIVIVYWRIRCWSMIGPKESIIDGAGAGSLPRRHSSSSDPGQPDPISRPAPPGRRRCGSPAVEPGQLEEGVVLVEAERHLLQQGDGDRLAEDERLGVVAAPVDARPVAEDGNV